MKIADRIQQIPPSGIRKFFEMVIGMDDVISLGVGEPDFVTPWSIREACIYSLEKGYTSYTSNWGLRELRDELSLQMESDYGIYYNPEDQILVTTGVSEAIDLCSRAIVNPRDEVIVVEPCYVSYNPCIVLAGGKPVPVSTSISNDFKVTPEQIKEKITKKTKAIIFNYPNNPTGAVMRKKELEEIADVIVEYDLIAISDEVYDRLTYEGRHTCFASLNGMQDRTILLNGFSKSYAMTGWRIGYALGTPKIIGAMLKVHQYTMLCAPITAQMAAIDALKNGKENVTEMVQEYDRRRRLIVKGLNDLGLDCFEPRGAFYAFPSIKNTGMTSKEFAEGLLKEQKVAVVPGDVFGKSGSGFVRCAYAVSRNEIKEALRRIGNFLQG
ncbi:MAG: aminotransferase class I/II-fold pyridoxal phosphate-dependent enzyme [Methanocellales archaeon]|nr:aminotransferase class I/II-fold pyridoxal phosphate-dependent enzyme [Methanocellales archaeon]